MTQFAKEVDDTKHQLDLDEERERMVKRRVRRHVSMVEVRPGDGAAPLR